MAENKGLGSADNSLEQPDQAAGSTIAPEGVVTADQDPKAYVVPGKDVHEAPKRSLVRSLITRINIYLMLFIFVVFAALVVVGASYVSQKTKIVVNDEEAAKKISSGSLSEEDIKKISNTETKLGDPKQLLNIESNAIFSGKVLVRDSVDIAGNLNIGGPLQIPGLTVTGQTRFNNIQANSIELAEGMNMNGSLNVQQNVKVAGSGEFGGPISAPSLTVSRLELNQNLKINGHLEVGGNAPGAVAGTAAGGGGTVSINGSDTAGTININTGNTPPAGVLATISFRVPYAKVPRVIITPATSGAAGLNYYVIRNATSFSIATANAPATGASYAFDYFVIESGIQ